MSNYRSEELAAQFRALSNPHRLAVFRRLSTCCPPGTACTVDEATRVCVGDLGADLDIAPSTVSHHLKELAQAGLVRRERRGRTIECWVEPEVLERLATFFSPEPTPVLKENPMNDDSSCCGPAAAPSAKPSTSSCCGLTVEAATEQDALRQTVRTVYAGVAKANDAGQATDCAPSCCGVSDDGAINTLISTRLGYSQLDLLSVPEGADMGLGCGNPKAIAALQPGEVVVDLGSGGGFDAFLAAAEVGPTGRVIGIDMTPEMISKARKNAERGKYAQVEFRLGEIEHLPVADDTADVILSNCVINLSPDKGRVFREAFRVLKPGGRLAISDVVATAELPAEMRDDAQLVAGCMGNASRIEEVEGFLVGAGFEQIRIAPKDESKDFIRDWAPGRGVEDYVVSASIEAVKPLGA
jgi:arsenite methyltransferase